MEIEGGRKAVSQLGPYPTKIGREELCEIIDMWDFDGDQKERLCADGRNHGRRQPHGSPRC